MSLQPFLFSWQKPKKLDRRKSENKVKKQGKKDLGNKDKSKQVRTSQMTSANIRYGDLPHCMLDYGSQMKS